MPANGLPRGRVLRTRSAAPARVAFSRQQELKQTFAPYRAAFDRKKATPIRGGLLCNIRNAKTYSIYCFRKRVLLWRSPLRTCSKYTPAGKADTESDSSCCPEP